MYQGVIKDISTGKVVFEAEMFHQFKNAVKNINKRKINSNTQYRVVNEVKGMRKYRIMHYARASPPRYAYGKNKGDAVKRWNKEHKMPSGHIVAKIEVSDLEECKKR